MIPIGKSETRIGVTFRDNPLFSFSSTSHESGHAIYDQNLNYKNTILGDGASLGCHESQSLLWESHIISSNSFLSSFYEKFKKESNGYLDNIKFEDFYKYSYQVTKNLIRIEGDEVTYPLHIIIRYEIEKDLFNGVIDFEEIEKLWNSKYNQYFGKTPKNSKEGFMQDVHWSEGMFGYFPTYLLGRVYASQIEKELRNRIPDFDEKLKNFDFDEILEILKKEIHQFGRLKTTTQIIKDFTGSDLDSFVYIDYLKKKFYDIYEIDK